MSPETPSKTTKLCPTCGTRLTEDAVRCLVCGTDLSAGEASEKVTQAVQGSRMPRVTISLPVAILLVAVFLGTGAILVYFALQQTGQVVEPTVTPTITLTVTPTITPTPVTPTTTYTPQPSPTPESYRVSQGDTCSSIAFAFGVSINSIVLLNDLPAACDTLFIGQELLIPQPTATPTPLPTATLSAAEATEAACQKLDYAVQDNDTLSSIALNYGLSISVIKEYNGLVNDTVRSGQLLVLPLCERSTPGPTPTATPPPPYAAPNLLLPPDGAPFTLADDNISLQWASVGTLRQNEAYAVRLDDVTAGGDRRIVDYVIDTKYIVPVNFRPTDNLPHVIRWSVLTVRQVGTDNDGQPIWEPAGAVSELRVFTWVGAPSAGATPTP